MFYWLDVLAVPQQQAQVTGARGGSSGGSSSVPGFECALKACRSLLFVMSPWKAPTTIQRLWCLHEAMMALQNKVGWADGRGVEPVECGSLYPPPR